MKVTIREREDDITIVELTGRLDTSGVDEVSESLSAALQAANQSTIIDVSQVDFMGSRGLGLLLANGKRLTRNGHKLVLLNPTELVESVVRTTRLDQVLPIVHDLDEAIQQLGGVTSPSVSEPVSAETPAGAPSEQQPAPAVHPSAVREGELKLEIENELSELDSLNATLAEFLREHGVPHKATYAVNLAIDELVVNVIRYAYVDDDTHLINIELAIHGEQIILRIVDDGRPFDPRKGPELDMHAEDGAAVEMGLLLVLDMVDRLKYRRIDDTNSVEVRVHLFPEDERSDPSNIPGGHSSVQ